MVAMEVDSDDSLVKRELEAIPIESIAPMIAEEEAGMEGMICLVSGFPDFVWPRGNQTDSEVTWDYSPLEHAQIIRWLNAHPERIHATYESARAFVRVRSST
jgi:hypothetical protein